MLYIALFASCLCLGSAYGLVDKIPPSSHAENTGLGEYKVVINVCHSSKVKNCKIQNVFIQGNMTDCQYYSIFVILMLFIHFHF